MLRSPICLPLFAAGLLLLIALGCFGQQQEEWARLTPGEGHRDVVDLKQQRWKSYRIEIPTNARGLILRLTEAQAELWLMAQHGRPLSDDPEDAPHMAKESEYFERELYLNRDTDPPLKNGTYYVDVRYPPELEPPIIGKRPATTISFHLRAIVERARVDAKPSLGEVVEGTLTEEEGSFRTYALMIPKQLEAFRIDIVEAPLDLDLQVRRGRQALSMEDADWIGDSMLARESLLVQAEGRSCLKPGLYYVNVLDPLRTPFPVRYRLRFTEGPDPAPELLAFPSLPLPEAPLERAMAATVELLLENGGGSGSVVTPGGLVLTAEHVIRGENGLPVEGEETVVCFNLDPSYPPVESFRARVLYADRELDLAVLQIVSGLYRQPLPEGYVFPSLPIREAPPPALGEELKIIGYPETGGRWSRVPLTLSQGILSGFDLGAGGKLYKSDALIHSGNSGGAAVDSEYRLIGVPIEVVSESSGTGQMGYVRPVSYLPEEWLKRIREQQR